MSGSGESVVTIGTYDGVHVGHQQLIAATRAEADQLGLRSVVLTFDRHPSATLRPEHVVPSITGVELKAELIEATEVDEVVVLAFDHARAAQSPEAFAAELVTDLGARVVFVGENFRFGHAHRGDVALLERLGRDLGFSVRVLDLVADAADQVVVSSRRIRELLAAGAIDEANRFLGRPYELRGQWTPLGEGGTVVAPEGICRPGPGTYRAALRFPRRPPEPDEIVATVTDDGSVFLPLPTTVAAPGAVVGALLLARC